MGHLDRYKKKGGFKQLLLLIESFPPTKQTKFLELVESENATWAQALRDRLLTMERIMGWPVNLVTEIVPRMNLNILAIALTGISPEKLKNFLEALSAIEKRKVERELELVKPNPSEVATTHLKVIELVRQMVTDGELKLGHVDNILIDERTEERLLVAPNSPQVHNVNSEGDNEVLQPIGQNATPLSSSHEESSGDVKAMQTLVVNLQKENRALKSEVKALKDRLDAIRKIA